MHAPERQYRPPRRRVLAGLGTALAAGLAGCGSSNGDDTPTEPSFERLDVTSVFVHDGVDLSVPDAVPTVGSRANATLLVLPGDASAGAEQVADWLADGKMLGLLGESAEETWLGWARSEAVTEHFDTDGAGDADPDPQLLVAAAVDLSLPTYRTTWGNGPTDRDVLIALDDALVDIRDRREADQ